MSDAMMTYDKADGYVLLFGGLNYSKSLYNQTWSYHAGTWTQLHPKHSPPPRYDGMMAYDSRDKVVLLFGGVGPGGTFYNDTWIFSGGQWTDITYSTTGMNAIASGSVTYDSKSGRVILFGGYQDPCNCVDWVSNVTFAFANGNWTQLRPSLPNSSLPGQGASIAYDPRDGYVVEFGGWTYTAKGPTTWNYSNARWTELYPPRSPSWRSYDNLVYDPKLGQLILFGGYNQTGSGGLNDTWKFVGGIWTQLHPAQSPPADGYGPSAAAYDAADGYLLLFGGQSKPTAPSNDTWVFT
jgi:hypothetical protein